MSYDLIFEPGAVAQQRHGAKLRQMLVHCLGNQDKPVEQGILHDFGNMFEGASAVIALRNTNTDQIEQALFVHHKEVKWNMHQVEVRVVHSPTAAKRLASDLFDALCSECSSRYVGMDPQRTVFITYVLDTPLYVDFAAALASSRLRLYETQSSLTHSSRGYTDVESWINYWKHS